MKKILVLEDSPTRIRYFREWMREADLTIVSTASDALFRVMNVAYDVVFLDHELGYGEPSGSHFTFDWRSRKSQCTPAYPLVVLHTSSDWGAQRMNKDLQAMGYPTLRLPFYNMTEEQIHQIIKA